jgi:hypothetical protein
MSSQSRSILRAVQRYIAPASFALHESRAERDRYHQALYTIATGAVEPRSSDVLLDQHRQMKAGQEVIADYEDTMRAMQAVARGALGKTPSEL